MASVLALDLDGVLTTRGSCFARTGVEWDSVRMSEEVSINKVLEAAGEIINTEWVQAVEFYQTIDPTCIVLFNRLLAEFPKVHLLLVSEQRHLFRGGDGHGSEKHIARLVRHLEFAGVLLGDRHVSVLPEGVLTDRGQQVDKFVMDGGYDSCVVIDDCADGYTHAQQLVWCRGGEGFNLDCYFQTHSLLRTLGCD